VFFALLWFQFLSLRFIPWQFPLAGAFDDKNYLALRMSILAFAAAVIALDKDYHKLLRLGAAGVAPVALFMIYRSQSATSTIVGLLGMAVILGGVWFWKPLRGYRVLIVALFVAIVAGLTMFLGQDPSFSLMDQVLRAFGKDSTLTGRKELWLYADTLIDQKPWLGLGPGGFWLPERMDAQALLDAYFKPRGTAFSFHNSYVEIAVYLGLTGLALGLVGWVWSASINILRVLTMPTLTGMFFGAITLVAAARSYVESDLWRPFEFVQMIVWIGALAIIAPKPRLQIKPSAPEQP
jgi:exopolysaccharide production protein ExoQ